MIQDTKCGTVCKERDNVQSVGQYANSDTVYKEWDSVQSVGLYKLGTRYKLWDSLRPGTNCGTGHMTCDRTERG